MSILIFIVLIVFFTKYFKFFTNKFADFVVSLSIIDGVQYFLNLLFCFGCMLLFFLPIRLPYVYEHSFILKVILLIPIFCLSSLPVILQVIRNPNDETRQKIINAKKEKEEFIQVLEKSKKVMSDVSKWQEKYTDILKRCDEEINNVKKLNLSEDEMNQKIKEIEDKYCKEIETINNSQNNN